MRYLNNLLLDKNNNYQEYQLQILFLTKRLKVSLITERKNIIFVKQMVKANLENDYYFKLCYLLKTS